MTLVERRKHPRYSCELSVEVRPEDQTVTYPGVLADICLGGCFVSTVSPLPAGTAVLLRVHAQSLNGNGAGVDGVTVIAGRTVTSVPGSGMGIEFTGDGNSEASVRLKALIHLLEDGAQADTRTAI